ncbi:DNA-directed RNA polymerase I core subunit rpa12 [Rhizina undulata]
MATVGTLVFCSDCGNLLDAAIGSEKLVCEMCEAVTQDIPTKTVTTHSAPGAFPSALRLKKSAVQSLAAEDLQTEAKIKQKCPECGREEMWFYTLQLRSADEGATVFYRCECGHRFNTNN